MKTQLTTPIIVGEAYNYVINQSLMTQSQTDYVGKIEYSIAVNPSGTKTHSLLRVHNPEGYTDNFNDSYKSTLFYYFRRDHLGNTREVWCATTNKTEQCMQYYLCPSGYVLL